MPSPILPISLTSSVCAQVNSTSHVCPLAPSLRPAVFKGLFFFYAFYKTVSQFRLVMVGPGLGSGSGLDHVPRPSALCPHNRRTEAEDTTYRFAGRSVDSRSTCVFVPLARVSENQLLAWGAESISKQTRQFVLLIQDSNSPFFKGRPRIDTMGTGKVFEQLLLSRLGCPPVLSSFCFQLDGSITFWEGPHLLLALFLIDF